MFKKIIGDTLFNVKSRIHYVYVDIFGNHYNDVIMGVMAFQLTSLTTVHSNVYSGADQRKRQSSTSLAFVCCAGNSQMSSNPENVSI